MYQSTYKYSKVYTILWLLLAASPVALGKKKPPATQHKVEVHDAQPQENNLPTRAVPAVKTLTTAQQQWLSNAFKAKDSDKKRFEKLLGHIDHREAYVREAVFQTLHQLLTNNPKLASKNAIKHPKKALRKVGVRKETQEMLRLLEILVEANPKLALPISKIVVDFTSNKKVKPTYGDQERDCITSLTRTLLDQSSACADYLLNKLHKQARDVETNIITQSSNVTTATFIVAKQMLHTESVTKNPQYIEMMFNMALDGATLQEFVYDRPAVRDEAMQREAQALLQEMMQKYPSITKKKYDALVTLVQDEQPNMLAIAHLVSFAKKDHQYLKKPFSLLINIFQATDARVDNLAAQNYANSKGDGLLMDAMFSKAEKKQAVLEAQFADDCLVRIPALRLLENIVCVDPSYLPEVFATLQKCTGAHERSLVKKEALDVLVCVVKNNYGYTPEIVAIANKAVQDKEAYIKEAALDLLSAILEADDEYTTNQEISKNIQKLSQDKHVKVRQLATDLLNKYSLAAR